MIILKAHLLRMGLLSSPALRRQLFIVEVCNVDQETFNALFLSSINYALTGINSDRFTGCDVTASFTDDDTFSITPNPFDYAEPCLFAADVGTFTEKTN